MYRPDPSKQPWAAKVPYPHELPPITKITNAFTVDDIHSSFYEREVPPQFS